VCSKVKEFALAYFASATIFLLEMVEGKPDRYMDWLYREDYRRGMDPWMDTYKRAMTTMTSKRYLESIASNTCKALPPGIRRVNDCDYEKTTEDRLIEHICLNTCDASGSSPSSCNSRCKKAIEKNKWQSICTDTCEAAGKTHCKSKESWCRDATTKATLSKIAAYTCKSSCPEYRFSMSENLLLQYICKNIADAIAASCD